MLTSKMIKEAALAAGADACGIAPMLTANVNRQVKLLLVSDMTFIHFRMTHLKQNQIDFLSVLVFLFVLLSFFCPYTFSSVSLLLLLLFEALEA